MTPLSVVLILLILVIPPNTEKSFTESHAHTGSANVRGKVIMESIDLSFPDSSRANSPIKTVCSVHITLSWPEILSSWCPGNEVVINF